MKKVIFVIFLLMPLHKVISQDKIVTTNQDTIFCKILTVSSKYIKFEEKFINDETIIKFIETSYVSEYYRNNSLNTIPLLKKQNRLEKKVELKKLSYQNTK